MKPVAQAVAAARRWRFQTARLWLRWKPRLRWWSAAAAIGLVAALFTRGAEWAYSQLMAWTTWLPAISLLLAPLGITGIGRASCRERVCQYVWNSGVAVT